MVALAFVALLIVLFASMVSGRVNVLDGTLLAFGAAVAYDITERIRLYVGVKATEVVALHGMAQREASEGARQQGRNLARQAWEQVAGSTSGKAH